MKRNPGAAKQATGDKTGMESDGSKVPEWPKGSRVEVSRQKSWKRS